MPLLYGSLFSASVHGSSLDAAGMVCKYQVEIKRYARAF